MTERLTPQFRTQLLAWIGKPNRKFTLLYNITRDGCNGTVFHEKCDNNGPTVTLFYNKSGCVYGGYTSQSWLSSQQYVADNEAFIYCLNYLNTFSPYKYIITQESYAIYCGAAYGPTFGSGHDLPNFGHVVQINSGGMGSFQLDGTCSFGHAYTSDGRTINNITAGDSSVTELEVYAVEEMTIDEVQAAEEEPYWRAVDEWNVTLLQTIKEELECYAPPKSLGMHNVQILLIGPVGSGKSSFTNTINSIFCGRISSRATTGSVQHSLTTQFRKYMIRAGPGRKPLHFRICDTMGLEEGQGICSPDLPFILDGNIPDMFQFNPAVSISPETAGLANSPRNDDKIQCVAMVLDSSQVNVLSDWLRQKIQAMRKHITKRGIPLVVLLTKVDKVCPKVAKDVSATFRSKEVQGLVTKISELLGIPGSHVLPVKNYSMETQRDTNVDILALLSMRQMVWYADDHLQDMADKLETEKLSNMNIKD